MKINYGGLAFVIGFLLSLFIAFFGQINSVSAWILALLGLVVGLFNVTTKETEKFLIASIAFIVTFNALGSVFSVIPLLGSAIQNFFGLMVIFVAPATAVVAISSIISITKN
ncbi:MAG TPA: hypothetical protein PLX15_00365 [Candidatus Woesearchaeota archaeon]|nr:hypothetical protein [Candidatus Woesearchaeota archaeon]